jgi:hypothetical protein
VNASPTIFATEPQDANLDCEIADEALEAVVQIAGGCPTLMYNSYCFTCDNEARSTTQIKRDRVTKSGLIHLPWKQPLPGIGPSV